MAVVNHFAGKEHCKLFASFVDEMPSGVWVATLHGAVMGAWVERAAATGHHASRVFEPLGDPLRMRI